MIACGVREDTLSLLFGFESTYRVESTSKLERSSLLEILTFEKYLNLFGSFLLREILVLSGELGKLFIDSLRGHHIGIMCIAPKILSCR